MPLAEEIQEAQLVKKTYDIAGRIDKGKWQSLGPFEGDEVLFEMILDNMAEAGPLKWAHLQLELEGG